LFFIWKKQNLTEPFLKNQAVFVFDGYQERIVGIIIPVVAPTIVLNLDNDSLKRAYLVVRKKGSEQQIVISAFPFVSDQYRQNTAGPYTLKKFFSRMVQFIFKFIQCSAIA